MPRRKQTPQVSKPIPSDWVKHLNQDPEKRENFEKTVRNSFLVLSHLKTIIDEKIEQVASSEIKESNYSEPSWAYLQAHRNGKREGLHKIRELLNFLD